MRWRYVDHEPPAEARERAAVVECIDRWWATFATAADAIDAHFDRGADVDVPSVMAELAVVDPALMWEFGPAVDKSGHRLCITPEGRRDLWPLLEVVLGRAPSLPRWEFHGERLPDSPRQFANIVDGRTTVPVDGVTASVAPGYGHLIDVRLHLPTDRWPGDDEARRFAFYTTERLLGEGVMNRWIGDVDAVSDPPADPVPLPALAAAVQAEVDRLLATLPAVPRYRHRADLSPEADRWSSFELTPRPAVADDFPNWSDLFVAITPEPTLFQAAHARGFDSARFSRCGETFCYLKTDGRDGFAADSPFADRGDVKDALTDALSAAGLGCTLGGGTGRVYSYVELALTDVPAAADVVRAVLRDGRLHRRSWLLFYDADLAAEWIGVRPDTPAPPSLGTPA